MIGREALLEVITYNPATGEVTWLERPVERFKTKSYGMAWNRRHAGQPAGYEMVKHDKDWFETHVSIRVTLDGTSYSLSKLVWLYMTGDYPHGHVLHVNGDRRDLRWVNLRCPSHTAGNQDVEVSFF